ELIVVFLWEEWDASCGKNAAFVVVAVIVVAVLCGAVACRHVLHVQGCERPHLHVRSPDFGVREPAAACIRQQRRAETGNRRTADARAETRTSLAGTAPPGRTCRDRRAET